MRPGSDSSAGLAMQEKKMIEEARKMMVSTKAQ